MVIFCRLLLFMLVCFTQLGHSQNTINLIADTFENTGNDTGELATGPVIASLYLRQRLTEGSNGQRQTNAVAMFGVPFAPAELQKTTPLVVTTPTGEYVPASTSAYAHWPDGSVRWLRVIAQTDVANDGQDSLLVLRKGTPKAMPSLLSNTGNHWLIDTGITRYQLSQTGSALALSGPYLSGLQVYIETQRKRFISNDLNTTVNVEIDSPALVQMRIDGTLSYNTNEHADYTLRLRFLKNHSRVQTWLQFRNGRQNRIEDLDYTELGLRLNAATITNQYRWNNGQGSLPATLRQGMIVAPDDWPYTMAEAFRAYAYAGWQRLEYGEVKEYDDCLERMSQRPCVEADEAWVIADTRPAAAQFVPTPGFMGVTITENGTEVLSGNKNNQSSLRWLSAGQLATAVDLMPATPASGYRINSDGDIDIIFYGIGQPRQLLWGETATYELMFDASPNSDPERLYQAITWPVWGRTNWQRYRNSGALYGQHELLDAQQEADLWLITLGRKMSGAEQPTQNRRLLRQHAIYYFRNYREWYLDVIDALKTGSGGKLQNSLEFSRYIGDKSIWRTTNPTLNWDFSLHQPVTDYSLLEQNRNLLDGGHQTTLSIMLLAFTTTEPWLAEIARDYGEYLAGRSKAQQDYIDINVARNDQTMRENARAYRALVLIADLLDALGDHTMRRLVPWPMIERMARTKAPEYPTATLSWSKVQKNAYSSMTYLGQSINRGYYYGELAYGQALDSINPEQSEFGEPVIHEFFMEIWADAMMETAPTLRWLADNDTARQALLNDFDDMWTGFSQFQCNEALFEFADNKLGGTTLGVPNDYWVLGNNPYANNNDGWFAYLYAYYAINQARRLGDERCLAGALRSTLSKTSRPATGWYRGKLQIQQLWHDYLSRTLAGKSLAQLQALRMSNAEQSLPVWGRLPASLSDAQLQQLANRYANFPRPQRAWQSQTITTTTQNDGTLKIHWTALANTEEIAIRCANKNIVPWLHFDREQRTYRYNPNSHIPWFAATHNGFYPVTNEQATISSNTEQSNCAAFSR